MSIDRTLDQKLIAYIERPQRTHWWGRWHDMRPRVLPETFGDGRLLLTVQTMDDRPHYYVIAVDSSWWDREANDLDNDLISEKIDPVVDALEEHFGRAWDEDDPNACKNCCGFCEWCEEQTWPLVSLGSGFGWGSLGAVEEITSEAEEARCGS